MNTPRLLLAAAMLALAAAVLAGAAPRRALPPIVFVSRQPAAPGAIPGLGPHHRAIAPGGRLMVRDPDGTIRALVAADSLADVSDPAVSPNGRWIAFAGRAPGGGAWRIQVVGPGGTGLRTLTAPPASADDLDPAWVGNDLVVFASTRGGARAEYADVPVTDLWLVRATGGEPVRITWERNGAEEPVFDPASGRIVYARWWFNRFLASAADPSGLTTDPARALPRDSVNLWQAVEIDPDGTLRLALGDLASRRGTMAYQPARLADGSWVGVYAANLGLSPGANGTGIQRFARGHGAARILAGAVVADRAGDAYHGARGLAPSSACAPAGLPDGRIAFAFDPGARGDFGIYVMRRDGGGLEVLADLPGTLELDPAPVVARRPRATAGGWDVVVAGGGARDTGATFVYDCRDVFAVGSAAGRTPGAPRRAPDLTLRFFTVRVLDDGRDTVLLVREQPVATTGRVRATELPAATPMFEQLVDRAGRPVTGALGPAHVAGFNYGRPETTARCTGCHLGHSTLTP